jgi:hypothetical protein
MHNPLRSEREVFRAVLIVAVAAGAVVVLTVLTRPAIGAALLAAEVGLGVGLLWRAGRGTLPRRAEISRRDDSVYRILVLANETVGGRALLDEIRNRVKGRNSEILLVVPALTSSHLEHWTSDVDAALDEAQDRLDASLATMASAGLRARGHVGDHHEPNAALEDALREFPADEVVISTHPPERSRWLERGVVTRAREEVPLPITHVVVDLEAEAGEAPRTARAAS